jgi:hypothetical protein
MARLAGAVSCRVESVVIVVAPSLSYSLPS